MVTPTSSRRHRPAVGGSTRVRFLHTSDWQLGMTRHYLEGEAQGRFAQARVDAVVRAAEVATERGCGFAVVAGDVFETSQPDRRTVGRALEALAAFTVPVYLLPGNHDPYDPGSVYRSAAFTDACPDHVEILHDRTPRTPTAGVEVVGAPWTSKRPLTDLVSDTCAALAADGTRRVVVGHGPVDVVVGDHDQAGLVRLADLEATIADGRVGYVALGDRHSALAVGDTGRIWYSGAPEPTGYREERPGRVLVVDLPDDVPEGPPLVEEVQVGSWHFHELARSVDGDADLDLLLADLDAVDDKARAVVKLKVDGSLTLTQAARMERELEAREDVFGALEHPERHTDVVVVADDADLDELRLTGYAAVARDRLRERAAGDGDDAEVATDALGLLVRLAGETTR
jgi:DNA repair exonuclease SbcCD nuclease subunit